MFKTGIIKYCLLAFFALFFLIIKWQTFATSLMPGDLFVITVNSNPDLVEFVSRVDMITGTKIYLSDDARTSGGTWRATEWYITFISSKLIPKGTKVMLTGIDTVTQFVFPAWIWTITRNNSFDLSTSSENLLAYQGTSYNQVSPSFIYWLWFWGPSTWIVTWIPTANNSYLPPSLSFWLSALNLNSNNQIQYNCTNTALLDPSFVTAYYSASNRNSGAVAYGPSPCVFDLIKPALSISLSTGQSSFTSWHILKFFVSATEAMSTGSFTCSDIVLSGSFVGTSVCNSVLEISPFNKTKFEVTVTATWNGIINMNILSGTVSDVAWNSNSPSIVISNTVTIDQTAPVVTLSGLSPMTIAQGWSYTEQGATRTDNVDGTWTIASPTSGSVNTAVIGIYVLEYNYTDTGGNISNTVTRTVNVTDQTAPVVTLSGFSPMTIAQGWSYTEQGATRTDNVDGTWTIASPTSGSVNTAVIGIYVLEYNYTDTGGNISNTVTRTVNVTDQTAPVVTLNSWNMTIDWGGAYTELGATWTDNVDGTWTIASPTSGSVNTAVIGIYVLEYNYTDTGGNISNTVTRTVNVTDQTAPVVTLNSWNMTINWGDLYSELGATWTDNVDGNGTINFPTSGTMSSFVPWIYTLEYSYTDAAWYTGTATRIVTVWNPWIPQPVNDFYNMAQDTWLLLYDITDNDIDIQYTTSWGMLIGPIHGTYIESWAWIIYYPNTGYVGVDTFVYQLCNILMECGTGLVTITIQDTQAPVVTLNSWNMTIDWGGAYTELGATWTDDIDGSWDITRPTTGSVDNYTPWLYILEYTYTDTGGNSGTAIRNVIVSSPWIPQPVDDNYSMPQDTASPLFSVTSNDINVQFITSWGILVDPLNGTYFVTSGWIFYYPNTGYVGVDTFVYQICNIYNQCGTGLVTVTVNAISSGSTPSSPLGGWAYVSQPIPNNNNPEIPTTPDIDTPGVDMNIFNPDIDSTTCFAPMDKLTVDQGNDMTQMFRIAHQMLYSYGLTTIPGTQDFMLDRKITRAEAAKFFVQFAQNVLCRQKIKTYDNRFNDIGDLYPDLQTNIILSNEYGIFYGSESNKFNPNSFITRDELIAVIMRLVTGKYDDAEWSDRAANYRINLENHTSIDLTNTTRWKLAEVIYDLYKHNKFELGDSGYLLQ